MSRDSQAIARVVQSVLRGGKGRAPTPLLLLACVLLAGYLFFEPSLERSWGVDLPGVHEYAGENAPQGTPPAGRTSGAESAPRAGTGGQGRQATSVESLIRSNSDTYTSPAGLRYSRGTQHGHHLRHLMAHAEDEPNRPGQHGVFDSNDVQEVVDLVDEAYRKAERGVDTRERREGDRTVYVVDMRRRVGYVGGQSGGRRGHPPAEHIQLVLVGEKLITAYPLIP